MLQDASWKSQAVLISCNFLNSSGVRTAWAVNRGLFRETRQESERRLAIVRGCGVGCKNALGMQRPHVRQRERALCENSEAECQSYEYPPSLFFYLGPRYDTSLPGVHKDGCQFPGTCWCPIQAVQVLHAGELTFHEVGKSVGSTPPLLCALLCATLAQP